MKYTPIMQNFNAVLEKYGLGKLCSEPERMGGSSSNVNFALETPQGRYFCRMRGGFGQRDALLHRVLTRLTDKGFPTASLLRTTTGETYVQHNNRVYELFPFIQGEEFERGNQAQFISMGGLIAQFHECMQEFVCPFPFEYFIGDSTWNNYPHIKRQAQFIEYTRQDVADREGQAELKDKVTEALGQIRQAMKRITSGWEQIESCLPRTLVHGDYHPYNVLFKGNEAAYICDFDFVMPAERIFDIITPFVWYRWVYEAYPEDREEPAPDAPYFEPYQNFLSSYNEQSSQELTSEELRALVPDMQRLLLLYGSKAAMHNDDLGGMLKWIVAHLKRVEWLDRYRAEFERAFLPK